MTSVERTLSDRLLDGRLKFRHLVILTAVADHGSLVRTAEQLHITQPVLTRTLKELESILGVQLFERSPRGMTPTVYGVAFLESARAILGQVRQAGRNITDIVEAQVGTVRVGTHLAGSSVLLPKAIARLKSRRPGVTVVVHESTPDLLLEALLTGDLDLTVGRITPLAAGVSVKQVTLYHEPVGLVTRPQHPAQSLRNPSLRQLIDYPWIFPVEQTALRFELEQTFLNHGLPVPQNRVDCTSILTLRALLIDSDHIAALPIMIAQDDSSLAVLPIALESLRRPVGITLVPGRLPTPTITAFIQELHDIANEITHGFGFADDRERWI